MFEFFKKLTSSEDNEKEEKSTNETVMSPNENIYKAVNIPFNFSKRTDDYRCILAYEDGGVTCGDYRQVDKLRSVGKEMIKLIGRKILSGELNLTKISFPIRACAPKTALENSINYSCIFPHFLNVAAQVSNPLERFKLVTTALFCSSHYTNLFLKPLNPILGETLEAEMKDGTKIYCEQISHHPPISFFLIYGPGECYQFSGYYDFQIKPGFNSLNLKNSGKRKFLFKDGTEIVATYPSVQFSSTFIGTARVEQMTNFSIVDTKHQIECQIKFGKQKKRPSDYIQTSVQIGEKKLSFVEGTYCGYLEFDGIRYWDARDFEPYPIHLRQNRLHSDWTYREDIRFLLVDQLDPAQKQKERLEELQRVDEKMRKKHKKALKKQ